MSAAVAKKPEPQRVVVRENELKWGRSLMEAGWTALPSIILERQQALGLDAIDVNILLHIVRHWWKASSRPFPSKKTIADAMGINARTVQRRIAAMEHGGLIRRYSRFNSESRRQKSNEYDLRGLISAARPYAKEKAEVKKRTKQEQDEQRLRKREIMRIAR